MNTLMPMHPHPYPDEVKWRGWMIRAIDGDTIAVKLDLGFRISLEVDVRLKDVDSPEVVGANAAEGKAAREFVNELLPAGSPLLVVTTKMRRSFNRYVASVGYISQGEWRDLATAIVEGGHGAWV